MIDVLGETWLTDPLKAIELVSGAILALAALTISVLACRLNKQNSEQIRLNAVVNSNREALAWSQGAFNVLLRVTSLRLQPGSEITPEVFKASRRALRAEIYATLHLGDIVFDQVGVAEDQRITASLARVAVMLDGRSFKEPSAQRSEAAVKKQMAHVEALNQLTAELKSAVGTVLNR